MPSHEPLVVARCGGFAGTATFRPCFARLRLERPLLPVVQRAAPVAAPHQLLAEERRLAEGGARPELLQEELHLRGQNAARSTTLAGPEATATASNAERSVTLAGPEATATASGRLGSPGRPFDRADSRRRPRRRSRA